MPSGQSGTWNKLASLGPCGQAALVTGALVVAWLALAPLAGATQGSSGLAAAAVGAGVCWLGATFALLIGALVRGQGAVLQRMVLGMMARAMFPLMLGAMLHMRVQWLAAAGMIYYLLVFYMVGLAVETLLLLAQVAPTMLPKKAG